MHAVIVTAQRSTTLADGTLGWLAWLGQTKSGPAVGTAMAAGSPTLALQAGQAVQGSEGIERTKGRRKTARPNAPRIMEEIMECEAVMTERAVKKRGEPRQDEAKPKQRQSV